MNYSDAERAESIDSRSSNLNLQPRKGRGFFSPPFSWRAQASLSSPPVSTVSPQQINTTNTFAALVEAGHTQLPTIMSQHWRKFTTKEEHLSKLKGNKAGAVLPHEICLVIRHKCMCVLYFIFRQVLSQARCLDMIVDQTASLHLLLQPSSYTSGVWMEPVIYVNYHKESWKKTQNIHRCTLRWQTRFAVSHPGPQLCRKIQTTHINIFLVCLSKRVSFTAVNVNEKENARKASERSLSCAAAKWHDGHVCFCFCWCRLPDHLWGGKIKDWRRCTHESYRISWLHNGHLYCYKSGCKVW